MDITNYILPIIVGLIIAYALYKKVDIWNEFLEGAKENLKVTVDILPALIGLMLCVGVFRSSGAIGYFTTAISPFLEFMGFPPDCVPLGLIRPLSGSGALATYENILANNPPDSFTGMVASVMYGGTETTFYTATVYFGATKIKNLRHTIPCALVGDLTGPFICAIVVQLMFTF